MYLAIQLGAVGLYWLLARLNRRLIDWHSWDGTWYLQIAQHGYLGVDPTMRDAFGHRTPFTPMVFFPGYPLAVKIVDIACWGNYLVAGLIVSSVAGVVAAYGITRLVRRVLPQTRADLIAVALFAAMPLSITYALTYPEALLAALAAWALVGMVEGRWWFVAPCVLAAGYVSPMAAPLIAVTVIAGLVAIYRGQPFWWPLASVVLAPVGMACYLVWVVATTGGEATYFTIQSTGWGSRIDFGLGTVRWMWQALTRASYPFVVLTVLLTFAVIGLAVRLARSGAPWSVWMYTAGSVLFVVVSAGIEWDKLRLLLAAFPVVLPLADKLARQSTGSRVVWLAAIVLCGLWISASSLSTWGYSI